MDIHRIHNHICDCALKIAVTRMLRRGNRAQAQTERQSEWRSELAILVLLTLIP